MSNSDDRVHLTLQIFSRFSSKKVFEVVVKPDSDMVQSLLWLQFYPIW